MECRAPWAESCVLRCPAGRCLELQAAELSQGKGPAGKEVDLDLSLEEL